MSHYDMSAFLGVFLDEVEEQLQILDKEILRLEKDPQDRETIQSIFRAAHTLKGSSSAMGFVEMKELTHAMENIFDRIRNQQMEVDVSLTNVFFECIDCLKVLKESMSSGTGANPDILPLIAKLESILRQGQTVTKVKHSENRVVQLDPYQKEMVLAALGSSSQVMKIEVHIEKDALMKSARAYMIHNSLTEAGELLASFPPTEEIENTDRFNGYVTHVLVTQRTGREIEQLINQISEVESVFIQKITDSNLCTYCSWPELATGSGTPAEEIIPFSSPTVESRVKLNQTVRVDVDRLESLMNLVGELVIDQTRLVEVKNRFVSGEDTEEDADVLSDVTNHLTRVINELQEGMMKTRMLPIEQLFNRFPRMVRDVAQKAGKEIEFIVEGKETELDRTLIEEIGDPLIHLLRNGLDHGIEEPEERERLGKPVQGKLWLKAAHEENNIVITIQDDGRGIDPHKIKASAVAKGLLSQEDADKLTEKELVFLIFKSGFSTANKVTEISGRGVGMDIVRAHIEKLNGIIDIDSTPGNGTTFVIKLPLTLAIIRSLLVKLQDQTFSIPLVNVLEIINLATDAVKTIKNRQVAVVRGRVLPLVRMHKRLGIPEEAGAEQNRSLVVVIGLADKRVGLIVDRTIANQEVVIKSLGRFLGNPPFLSGATILGDGNVALIMDVGSIVKQEGIEEWSMPTDQRVAGEVDEEETQLVTFTLDHEEYGLEIHQVKDIISVPPITRIVDAPSSILGVINVRGIILPLMDPRRRFHLPVQEVTRTSRIMVVEMENDVVGILVDQVTGVIRVGNQTIEQPPDVTSQHRFRVIKGICKLPDRMIILPEVDEFFQKEWLTEGMVDRDLARSSTIKTRLQEE